MSFTFNVVTNVTQPNGTGTQLEIGGGLAPAFNAINALVNQPALPPPPPSPAPSTTSTVSTVPTVILGAEEEAVQEEEGNNPNN
jgi:hypothetical protein